MKVFDRSSIKFIAIWGIALNPFFLPQLLMLFGERRTVLWGGTADYKLIATPSGIWSALIEMQLLYLICFSTIFALFLLLGVSKFRSVFGAATFGLIAVVLIKKTLLL